MSPDDFYRRFRKLVLELKPDCRIADLSADTHLWATGFVDSVSMLEIVELVEEITGGEIDLSGSFLQNFVTMEAIYNTYISKLVTETSSS